LVGNKLQDQGKKKFFYQTLNSYWNFGNKKFKFGIHSNRYFWDVEGNLVTDLWDHTPRALFGIRMEAKKEERRN
jgi:hypothetical protein